MVVPKHVTQKLQGERLEEKKGIGPDEDEGAPEITPDSAREEKTRKYSSRFRQRFEGGEVG